MSDMRIAYDKQFWTLNEGIWPEFRYKVIQNKGAAFTIELSDEDDKNFFTRGEVIGDYNSSSYKVEESIRSMGIRRFPEGIRIHKIPMVNADGRKIRRVYMSVSDKCASYIFNTRYAEVGVPFYNLLMSKHSDLMQDIYEVIYEVDDYSYHRHIENYKYFVLKSSITRPKYMFFGHRKNIRHEFSYPWKHKYDVEPTGLSYLFEKKGMQPLSSIGQQYGMALALIEIFKKNQPEISNAVSEIVEDICGEFLVCFHKRDDIVPTAKPKELTEW